MSTEEKETSWGGRGGVGRGDREEKTPGFNMQNPGKIANCLLPELTGTLLHGSERPTSGVCPVLSGLWQGGGVQVQSWD